LLSQGGLGHWSGPSQLDAPSALLAAGAAAPLFVWRRWPFAAFVAAAAVSIVMAALGYALGLAPAPTVALFLVAATRDADHPWTTSATAMAVALFALFLAATAASVRDFPGSEVLHGTLFWSLAWFAGDRTRLAHEHLAGLADRAERAEREAEQARRLAVAEERARIARDIHDSAGQAVSLIAMRAGTARLRYGSDLARCMAALETIEHLARKTAGEIDSIVGALREGDDAPSAGDSPIGLASLATLIDHHETMGLRVTLHRTGTPVVLSAPVDQAAYRIIQEALANAARHGTGAADVAVDGSEGVLAITVTNPVAPFGTPDSAALGRYGLVGMRERAALVGGRVEVAASGDRFEVHATLPCADRGAG
jgi:signal transduction histidine kinase